MAAHATAKCSRTCKSPGIYTEESGENGVSVVLVGGRRRIVISERDGICDPDESCSSCEKDCGECTGECGDGVCDGPETAENCPADCQIGSGPTSRAPLPPGAIEADAPPLFFFYAVHVHGSKEYLPYADPGRTVVDPVAAENMLAAARARLGSEMEAEYARWTDLTRRLALYDTQILTQSQGQAQAALLAYQSDAGDQKNQAENIGFHLSFTSPPVGRPRLRLRIPAATPRAHAW